MEKKEETNTARKWDTVIEGSLYRLKIFGGWLVSEISDVDTVDANNQVTSICFVPDPKHEWDLNEEY